MKVILISMYSNIQAFGIRTLSACLKRKEHNVQIIFLPRHFTDRYEDKTLNEIVTLSSEAELIGISVMTNFFDNAVQITQKLKENLSIPVLWGGIHPTIRPAECLNYADMACIGEGEETLIELAQKIKGRQNHYNIQGIVFKDKENIITNKMRPLIQTLDSIPFPDYDYESHYILNEGHVQKMNKDILKKYMGETYMTMPTRGCPFGCSYCCNNTINKMYPNQKPVRKRSVDNIIKELIKVKSSLSFIEYIKFDDDSFFAYTVEEMTELCEKYKENIGLPLMVTGATPSTLTREKLSLLVDAGLIFIRMGIQTGSERTQKLYKRHYSNQQVEKSANVINEFKDKIKLPQYDIILDNPWETEEDLIETLMLLARLPIPYVLALYSLTFYPETELHRIAKKDGIITDERKEIYNKHLYNRKTTYLNKLFSLLNRYAIKGHKLSPKMMSLLTNQKLKQLKLNWLLYGILRLWAVSF